MIKGCEFETKELYGGCYRESYEGTGAMKAREFNDIIAILRTWIRENKIKIDDLAYISITIHDGSYKQTFDVTYNVDRSVSKKISVDGPNPIGLEDFIRSHWDINQ